MIRQRLSTVAVLAAAALLLAGCSSADEPSTSAPPATESAAPALSGDLTIFAAASLTASFNELATDFMKKNPGVTVKPIDYDGSSTLATQIIQGAPVDVFASADQANMDKVKDQADASTVFANNTLQIAVQKGNPKGITGLADLAKSGMQVVLCAPAVPCGAAAVKILGIDNVSVKPVSEEQNVKAVITKVQSGDADAGLVYVTDVKATNGAVDGVDIENTEQAANAYPIAVMKDAANPDAAKAFVDYVLSADGQAILAKYGFAKP
jgi:molybdate transport system substrate-binding protein